MSDTMECQPSERELALSTHRRSRAFRLGIEAKAVALATPAQPAPLPPDTAFFRECWFMIESVSPCLTLPMATIKRAVCERYGVSLNDLVSHRVAKAITLPRHIAMYLCKELTEWSLPAVGRAFEGRDHTTVLYAVRKIERLLASDDQLAAAVGQLRADLEARL